jgi:transcriptional regulator with XRE-family HTH domain
MKLYNSIGQLLKDYRAHYKISKIELASKLDMDIRTLSRWESDDTLLKPNMEEELVEITFIPYQVIRNLNAPISIPTYYDFSIRKYATTELSINLPNVNWFKNITDLTTDRLQPIKTSFDIENIIRATLVQVHISKPINEELILMATELLPEINFIIYDTSGFYSAHSIFLPLKPHVYQKIRDRSISEYDITCDDLVESIDDKQTVYYAFDINFDCNETFLYVASALKRYFTGLGRNYTYASYTARHDTIEINNQLGAHIVWEDEVLQKKLKSKERPRLYECITKLNF